MSFADNLKYLRKVRGLTQKQLGQELNVALSTIGMWETGSRRPDLNTTMTVAKYFGVTVSDLIEDEEYDESDDNSLDTKHRGSVMSRELAQIRDMLRTRPEMKMLFSVSKNASKDDIERAVAIIEALKEQNQK